MLNGGDSLGTAEHWTLFISKQYSCNIIL